jgi:hypothetical protein
VAEVERAVDAGEVREAPREAAAAFYSRLAEKCGSDVDLDAVIRASREIHMGLQL